jgi:hypothetical protein
LQAFKTRWEHRATAVCLAFADLLKEKHPHKVWLEQPEAFSNTSTLSGSQFKLDCLCGMLIGACELNCVTWAFVRVRDWKGQVPKAVSNQRTRVTMGLKSNTNGKHSPPWFPRGEHAWDALGIACYVNKKLSKVT